jgi:prefoldin subunit 5
MNILDKMLKTNILQSGLESDSVDQLQNKLKRYTTEIESLRGKGIGTDKLKEELYEAIYTSRYLPIDDRKNKPFHELLVRLYGSNQVIELASICTKDVLQSKQERDHANEIKWRDEKIDELTRQNQALNAEIERLKAAIAELSAKSSKPLWRPVPASSGLPSREANANKTRQTLRPTNVQFGSKPGAS